jgi:hypothetical protein
MNEQMTPRKGAVRTALKFQTGGGWAEGEEESAER